PDSNTAVVRAKDILRYGFFFQAEDGIRDYKVTGVQTCALPISAAKAARLGCGARAIASQDGQAILAHARRTLRRSQFSRVAPQGVPASGTLGVGRLRRPPRLPKAHGRLARVGRP